MKIITWLLSSDMKMKGETMLEYPELEDATVELGHMFGTLRDEFRAEQKQQQQQQQQQHLRREIVLRRELETTPQTFPHSVGSIQQTEQS